MQHWLLVRGRGGAPLEAHVDASAIAWHASSRRPAVSVGDRAVLYAAEWQAVFGIVEITGEAEHDAARERWAWRFGVRPLAVVGDLRRAPAVEVAGVFPQSIWRHSHIRLSEAQYEQARRLIVAARPGVPNDLVLE